MLSLTGIHSSGRRVAEVETETAVFAAAINVTFPMIRATQCGFRTEFAHFHAMDDVGHLSKRPLTYLRDWQQ